MDRTSVSGTEDEGSIPPGAILVNVLEEQRLFPKHCFWFSPVFLVVALEILFTEREFIPF